MKSYHSNIGEYNKQNWNVIFNVLRVAGPNCLRISDFLLKMVLSGKLTGSLKNVGWKIISFCKMVPFQVTFVHFHVPLLQTNMAGWKLDRKLRCVSY